MASAEFWDGISQKYSKTAIRNIDAYHASLARTRTYLNAEDRVLEMGCGTGSTAILLAPEVALYTGSDISPGMIEIARGKTDAPTHLDFTVATAEDDTLGASYDVVMAFNLLHLVDDLRATLRHMHAITRPGGLIITKTPCLGDKKWLFGPLLWVMQRVGKAPQALLFTIAELERAIKEAGFEIIEAEDYGSRYIVARKPS